MKHKKYRNVICFRSLYFQCHGQLLLVNVIEVLYYGIFFILFCFCTLDIKEGPTMVVCLPPLKTRGWRCSSLKFDLNVEEQVQLHKTCN